MKSTKRDTTHERRILTGMVVDSRLLGHIADKWDGAMFNSRWSNIVGEWCVEHFRSYGKAPQDSIEPIFEGWAEGQQDKEVVEIVDRFLSGLSGEYKQLSKESQSEFLVDKAADYFNKVRLNKLIKKVESSLERGKGKEAMDQLQSFHKLEMGNGAAVSVMRDKQVLMDAFQKQTEPLIKYPQALGNFFGNSLERDGLIAFMGPEKRGKTFWLMDIAWRAAIQRRRVVFFAVGDMSQDQMMRRFATRAARRPLEACKFKYPTTLMKDPDLDAEITHDERETTSRLSWQQAYKSMRKVLKTKIRSDDDYLKMSVHPNSSISVTGIAAILSEWERDGWTPDVVVIDYADILAPPPGQHEDTRAQTNGTWKQLRALSQSRHCLVVTATQSDAASYSTDTVKKQHFSEDKRKLAHVTGMIGLNANDTEKSNGLMRLNWIVRRESAFAESQCVHVAGCLAIANPAIRSVF